MNILVSLIAVGALFLLGTLGARPGMGMVFGVVLPYAAVALFVVGMVYRVLKWASVPVPFRIPTTCGQQKSLDWIRHDKLENPHNRITVIGRMILEVFLFRSLLRDTRSQLVDGRRLVYGTNLWLWGAAMLMHGSLLIVLIRHIRLVTEPVPFCVTVVERVDGFLEVGLPGVFVTSVLFLLGAALLLLRRLASSQLRYISLVGDYIPMLLLLSIGGSGVFLRHFTKTDVTAVKELALGLAHFSPVAPAGISSLFYAHLFLVCVLLAYIPFGKLTHMAGVFLSPTRNLANSNRRVRHVNPWNYPVKVHTYDEYEDDLREKMKTAGIPVEKP